MENHEFSVSDFRKSISFEVKKNANDIPIFAFVKSNDLLTTPIRQIVFDLAITFKNFSTFWKESKSL